MDRKLKADVLTKVQTSLFSVNWLLLLLGVVTSANSHPEESIPPPTKPPVFEGLESSSAKIQMDSSYSMTGNKNALEVYDRRIEEQ